MKQEKPKQKSTRRRIKNKIQGTAFGLFLAGFIYCVMVKRSFSYAKKKQQR